MDRLYHERSANSFCKRRDFFRTDNNCGLALFGYYSFDVECFAQTSFSKLIPLDRDKRRFVSFRHPILDFDAIQKRGIVFILCREPFTLRDLEAMVAGRVAGIDIIAAPVGPPFVRMMQVVLHARVFFCDCLDRYASAVGRTVVNGDDLHDLICLIPHRVDCASDALFFVPYRNYDRDEWHVIYQASPRMRRSLRRTSRVYGVRARTAKCAWRAHAAALPVLWKENARPR